ncbi:MAG TPA: hypothetical protein PLZ15_06240 [Melioribacteraceae bacterium]|nr:hypothetical protein [Melioribacteraceae bacterium]
MSSKELADELFRNVFDDPWHGASVSMILNGITHTAAFNKPLDSIHSIAEILLHMTSWTVEVERRLSGEEPDEPEMGDWPDATGLKKNNWDDIKDSYFRESEKLIGSIRVFPDSGLNELVGSERNASLGTGFTYKSMILGMIQHNAYHSAQISILKKIK